MKHFKDRSAMSFQVPIVENPSGFSLSTFSASDQALKVLSARTMLARLRKLPENFIASL